MPAGFLRFAIGPHSRGGEPCAPAGSIRATLRKHISPQSRFFLKLRIAWTGNDEVTGWAPWVALIKSVLSAGRGESASEDAPPSAFSASPPMLGWRRGKLWGMIQVDSRWVLGVVA